MDNKQKTIFVYDDWSREFPVLMGRFTFSFRAEKKYFRLNTKIPG